MEDASRSGGGRTVVVVVDDTLVAVRGSREIVVEIEVDGATVLPGTVVSPSPHAAITSRMAAQNLSPCLAINPNIVEGTTRDGLFAIAGIHPLPDRSRLEVLVPCGRGHAWIENLSHPARTLSGMDIVADNSCEHRPVWVGRIAVAACADCARVEWFSDEGPVDHAEAMAALFGSYDLLGPLDALASPAPYVLAYAPPSGRKGKNLQALPPKAWMKAGPQLWMCHDGSVLLLATDRRLLFENLTRGA